MARELSASLQRFEVDLFAGDYRSQLVKVADALRECSKRSMALKLLLKELRADPTFEAAKFSLAQLSVAQDMQTKKRVDTLF